MGVDAQRRAGHQGHEVAVGVGPQLLGLLGLDDLGLHHAVGQHLAEDLGGEGVPRLDLVEVGEHGGVGQPAVPGDHRARAGPAHGQGGPLQVPQALQEGLVGGAVVDGQVQVDGRDAQTGHEAGAVGVQDGVVVQAAAAGAPGPGGNVRIGLQERTDGQGVVVGVGLGDLGGGIGIDIVHAGGVVGHDLGLVVLGHPARRRRVGQGQHADQGEQGGDEGVAREPPAAPAPTSGTGGVGGSVTAGAFRVHGRRVS